MITFFSFDRESLSAPMNVLLQSDNLVVCTLTSVLLAIMTNKRVYQRLLFPGVVPDSKYKKTHTLPPGDISGCPFIGSTAMMSSNSNKWLSEQSHKVTLSSPLTMFKSYFLFGPGAVIVGSSPSRKILNKEFSEGGVSQPVNAFGNAMQIFGKNSLSFETKNKSKYRFLRSLVGQSMTHKAVAEGIVALQQASESVVNNKILVDAHTNGSVGMEKHLKYLTLDVAWRQILGLKLRTDKEIEEFHENVGIWLSALTSGSTAVYFILPMALLKRTRVYKAKMYLSEKIMDKINSLEEKGCSDGSTVGAMLFTRDEDDPTKRLTRDQVIDNALLLIAAGSETSANTLTNCMLLLGLHPDIYGKLVQEQQALIASKGEQLTKEMLDNDCPYLEGFLKEVMRILPIAGGPVRKTKETITIDGYQIPKNWWVMPSVYVTHENDPVTKVDDGSHMDLKKGLQPERWFDSKTRPKDYMPWGAGYRFCAGHILAMAEMKTFLAVFCRKITQFNLVNNVNVEDIKWKFSAINTPDDGVPISISC